MDHLWLMTLFVMVATITVHGDEANGDVISYIQKVEKKVDGVIGEVAIMKEEIKRKAKKEMNPWLLQQSNVCFGAGDNKPGKFRLQHEGKLTALKLVHKSGYVTCDTREEYDTNWGCLFPYVDLGVYITDSSNRQIFPKQVTYPTKEDWLKRAWYFMPGYSAVSPVLVFTDLSSPMYGMKGQEIRVWYGEDLIDTSEGDNGGNSCADVYAQFS